MDMHTCTTCDGAVDFRAQRLDVALYGQYRHVDFEDCQAELRRWQPGTRVTWTESRRFGLAVARHAGQLEPGDDYDYNQELWLFTLQSNDDPRLLD